MYTFCTYIRFAFPDTNNHLPVHAPLQSQKETLNLGEKEISIGISFYEEERKRYCIMSVLGLIGIVNYAISFKHDRWEFF